MALMGHIPLGNHMVDHIRGPIPTSALGHSLDPHLKNLGLVAYGERTLRTANKSCILEFTNTGDPVPSLITDHGQTFHLGSLLAVAHGDLAQGVARGDYILLDNHEIA
jgi:hypothetical protein